YGRELGVEEFFTFAAMATSMRPEHHARVFCAATDAETLQLLTKHGMHRLEEGRIGGLNGILLGAAAEAGAPAACLLGEMPQLFAQLPFPKASLAVLRAFADLASVSIDLQELESQAASAESQLEELLLSVEAAYDPEESGESSKLGAWEESSAIAEADEGALSDRDEAAIERLFIAATNDRSKAYELKQELDRLGVFEQYEDRFLDLFNQNSHAPPEA
ncbi:MAG: PAC2 family protein, partial [Planctomycetales bacterium]|nr:PAC2 family protein [Planctomycetales bacterium]